MYVRLSSTCSGESVGVDVIGDWWESLVHVLLRAVSVCMYCMYGDGDRLISI